MIATTKVGLRFEQLTMAALQRFGASLELRGGPGDGGVDLSGSWRLDETLTLNVIAQCKRQERLKVKSTALREFEAVLSHHQRHSNMLGVFSSRSGYTIDALKYFETQLKPSCALIVVDEHSALRYFALNDSAKRLLPLLSVGVNYDTSPNYGRRLGVTARHVDAASATPSRTYQLFWKGALLKGESAS